MALTPLEGIRKKFHAVRSALGERGRRLWAGAEADAVGWGGVVLVSRATGMAISTVRKGRDESRRGSELPLGRERKAGAGRKTLEHNDPQLVPLLESLVNPSTRGDPESPLRWTIKSVRVLSRELKRAKHPASPGKVGTLLRGCGYSLQANAKTNEGASHPDRNAQFELINSTARDFLARGQPVISIDAKKKEFVGMRNNPGQQWLPKGSPIEVMTHDFLESGRGPVAIPYGIYDVGKNLGYVNVGTDHNTPTFAVASIEKWWVRMGAELYPNAKEIFVTADSGGSNAIRSNVFKSGLQALAERTGLAIHVSHLPPGTSKWNKIEHRLFSFVTLNWRGKPLDSYELIVALIGATTTLKGLRVQAELDGHKYPLGMSVSKHQVENLSLTRATFHGEWNYVLRPRSAAQLAKAALPSTRLVRGPHATKRAFWRETLRKQLASGLTPKDFCAEHGLKYVTFIKARLKLIGKIGKLKNPEE